MLFIGNGTHKYFYEVSFFLASGNSTLVVIGHRYGFFSGNPVNSNNSNNTQILYRFDALEQ